MHDDFDNARPASRFRDSLPPRPRRDERDEDERDRPRRRRAGLYRPTDDEATSAMLCHLLAIFTGFIGPIIMWVSKKDQSRFVDWHGREALNFALNILIYSLVAISVLTVIAIVTCGIGAVLVPLAFCINIYGMVMHILALSAAKRGEWYRYPMTFRMIGPPDGMENLEAPAAGGDAYLAPERRASGADAAEEPQAKSGSLLWLWITGGVAALLLGGCCVGGIVIAVVDLGRQSTTRRVAAFSPAPAARNDDPAPAGRPPEIERVRPGGGAPAQPVPLDPTRPFQPNDPIERGLLQMRSDNSLERTQGANALAREKPTSARRALVVAALRNQLEDKEQFARDAARQALIVWAGKDEVPLLLDMLRDAVFPQEKRKIIEVLGSLKDARASRPVAEALKDISTRKAAADALKQIGSAAEPDVIPFLQDRQSRQVACEVLKEIGTARSLPPLEALSKDRSSTIARAAREAADAIKARK